MTATKTDTEVTSTQNKMAATHHLKRTTQNFDKTRGFLKKNESTKLKNIIYEVEVPMKDKYLVTKMGYYNSNMKLKII